MKQLPNKNILKEMLRYAFFGGVTTILNLLMYYFMVELDMNYLIANVLSFVIAVVISYYFNKKWVFIEKRSRDRKNEFIRYVLVRFFSIVLDSLLLYIAVSCLRQDKMLSKVFISGGIILATYLLNKIYVFEKGKRNEEIH